METIFAITLFAAVMLAAALTSSRPRHAPQHREGLAVASIEARLRAEARSRVPIGARW